MIWRCILLLLIAGQVQAQDCAPVPKPIKSLSYESRYADDDQSRSQTSSQREQAIDNALKPLDGFIDDLAQETQALYVGNMPNRQAAAQCLMDRLGLWVSEDPLSNLTTDTVHMTIGSRYAALALILWQAQVYAPNHPAQNDTIRWLERRLDEQLAFWPSAPKGARKGNLRAWAALAAAAVSAQNNRKKLREWSTDSLQDVLCSVNPDGSLPQEMKRKNLALHYHFHAVAPLVTTAALLERQGVKASQICDDALHKLVDFVSDEIAGGKQTAKLTGVEQSLFDGSDGLEVFQLAWIEAYLALRHSEYLDSVGEKLRPLVYSKLGGNQTALWYD